MQSTSHSATALMRAAERATQREREAWKLALIAPDVVPPGWRTSPQWGKLWNKSPSTTRATLAILVERKAMIKKQFKIVNASGRALPQPHYKLETK